MRVLEIDPNGNVLLNAYANRIWEALIRRRKGDSWFGIALKEVIRRG